MSWKRADGAGEPRGLGGERFSEKPESYSADGKLLVFTQENLETGFDLFVLELENLSRRPFLATAFDERSAFPRRSNPGLQLQRIGPIRGLRDILPRARSPSASIRRGRRAPALDSGREGARIPFE